MAKVWTGLFLSLLLVFVDVQARSTESLLFMGESEDVVTVASGRPELPDKAPAVVTVVRSSDIESAGFLRLDELLNTVPGFFVLPHETGFSLYARGIKNGALLLYNGVPLTTDETKAVYPLGWELNLNHVKKVEIVRGPGSVLWGPDAFSAVINIVPKKGRDINGLKIKTLGGMPYGFKGVDGIFGKDLGFLDISGFASAAYNKSPTGKLNQEFYEAGLNLSYLDALEFTFRTSLYRQPAKIRFEGIGIRKSWVSRRDVPFTLARIRYVKKMRHTSFSVTGSFTQWNISRKDGPIEWGNRNRSYMLNAAFSRDFFDNRGLLTWGASFRVNYSKNAVVNVRGYIPDYISLNIPGVLPVVDRKSFDTKLYSMYAQYIHYLSEAEFWIGARLDKHTNYKSKISYNAGINVHPDRDTTIKFVAGTAYRTPYAYQFLRSKPDPEKVVTLSTQMLRRMGNFHVSFTLFYNEIKDHINEDNYYGYSMPADYSTKGLEFHMEYDRNPIKVWLSHTILGVSGEEERYRTLNYVIVSPEEQEFVYDYSKRAVDVGSNHLTSLGFSYSRKGFEASIWAVYTDGFSYVLPRNDKYCHSEQQLILNGYLKKKVFSNASLLLYLRNILNHNAKLKGVYSGYEMQGTTVYLGIAVSW